MKTLSGWSKGYLVLLALSVVLAILLRLSKSDYRLGTSLFGSSTLLIGCIAVFSPIVRSFGRGRAVRIATLLLCIGFGFCLLLSSSLGYTRGFEFTGYWVPSMNVRGGSPLPLFAPFSWMLIVVGCYSVAVRGVRGWLVPIVAGALATLLDLPLEPVKSHTLDYYRWKEPGPLLGIPWIYLAAWFVSAILGSMAMRRFGANRETPSTEGAVVLFGYVLSMVLIGSTGLDKSILLFAPILLLLFWDSVSRLGGSLETPAVPAIPPPERPEKSTRFI